jgi:hypothetical protein
MGLAARAWALATIFIMGVGPVFAQQETSTKPLPDAPMPKQNPTPPKHESPLQATFEILGRRSIFFPDLAASSGPLDATQKLELFVGKSVAPSRFLSSSLGAAIGQARGSLSGYGGEWGGYGKRFGSSLASGASTEFFSTFLFASLLHRDPRYFVMLRGRPLRRIGYGLSRLVVTRTDSGKEAFNWPGTLGPLFAESLANSYLPVSEQTAGQRADALADATTIRDIRTPSRNGWFPRIQAPRRAWARKALPSRTSAFFLEVVTSSLASAQDTPSRRLQRENLFVDDRLPGALE